MYEVRVVALDDVKVRLRLPQNLVCEKEGRNSAEGKKEDAITKCHLRLLFSGNVVKEGPQTKTIGPFLYSKLARVASTRFSTKCGHVWQETRIRQYSIFAVLRPIGRLCKRYQVPAIYTWLNTNDREIIQKKWRR